MAAEKKGTDLTSRAVEISTATALLRGKLITMPKPRAVIVVVRPAASVAAKARVDALLEALHAAQLATLCIDSLSGAHESREEGRTQTSGHANLRCRRLMAVAEWVAETRALQRLPIGIFATNSAVSAALSLAAASPGDCFALVSYAGRPSGVGADLLARVRTPTLLIVDESEPRLLAENRAAFGHLSCERRLDVLDKAEPDVSARALDWFVAHVNAGRALAAAQRSL